MARRLKTTKARFGVAVCAAALFASVGAGPALAGEITGNGNKEDFSQGRSICKFSGLNDDPTGTQGEGPGGRTQSFGQDVKLGVFEPSELKGGIPSPGFACNPNNGFGA